jgi:NlpC/P60 family putative phage cell wall peptidase
MTKEITVQARTWLGTPFVHQARLKGKGCDCLGLIVGVVDELGLVDESGRLLSSYDEINYSKEPDGKYLIQKLSQILEEVEASQIQVGDLALFKMGNNPQHLAIISEYQGGLGMIHCYAQARKVVEHRFDENWQKRLYKIFRIKNGISCNCSSG